MLGYTYAPTAALGKSIVPGVKSQEDSPINTALVVLVYLGIIGVVALLCNAVVFIVIAVIVLRASRRAEQKDESFGDSGVEMQGGEAPGVSRGRSSNESRSPLWLSNNLRKAAKELKESNALRHMRESSRLPGGPPRGAYANPRDMTGISVGTRRTPWKPNGGSKASSSITGYSIDGLPRYASSSPKTIDGLHVRRDKKGKVILLGY